MNTLYKAGIVFLFSALAAGSCPAQENISPCICGTIGDGISVQCGGQENADNIPSVIENFENSPIVELVLDSLSLRLLPTSFRQVFSLRLYDVRIEKVLPNSTFQWPKLSEVILESSTIAGKPLPDFKEAHLLNHFEISKIELSTIGSTFKENIPAALTYLDIRKTKTTRVESEALGHLEKLQYLIMVDLPLRELSRNTLPVVMPDLHTFILGNTKIERLETNFFHGMPKLEVLMLNGNKLTTLDSNLFAPLENQLTHLLAERNPLICDCNLLWLQKNAQNKESMKVLATCKDNITLKRKEVTSLDENEYCP